MRASRAPLPLVLALLWLAALLLCLSGLGNVPLRDWDEGIVARVALEISEAPWSQKWLPTYWWDPYLNKPPGLHLLIATAINVWRQWSGAAATVVPPEWVVRFIPALISSLLVPLMGALQASLRPGERGHAISTAAITLTLLPLVRHGRMAMLDGTQLVCLVSLWIAVLQAHGCRRLIGLWGIGCGASASALLLLKAPLALPMLIASLLLRWLDGDLTRKQWRWLILAVAAGTLPGALWHLAHALARGNDAWMMWGQQGFMRLHHSLENHAGGPIPPLMEILKGGGPWLLLWPIGLRLAWRERHQRSGRWTLGITLITAVAVLPLQTQLPWYSLLLWPGFCLSCGPALQALIERSNSAIWLRQGWLGLGLLLLSMGAAASLVAGPWQGWFGAIGLALGSGLSVGGWMLQQPKRLQRRRGVVGVVAGMWLALWLLVNSPLWLWELNESWSTADAAGLLKDRQLEEVVLLNSDRRPSLNWYAGIPLPQGEKALLRASKRHQQIGVLSEKPPHRSDLHCGLLAAGNGMNLYQCSKPQRRFNS
jgi:4-amino-4-deoxy-L-arabinose transferase-like glycosyltransferase